MPSSTPKQARTMAAAAHNPGFAKKVGIPQGVAKDFSAADQMAKAHALRRHKPATGVKAAPKPDTDMDGY